ncbi:uncharacterized protein A1O5_12657 [Cladophialophora psammophila CBS 110553]|uniref:Uncharacterized protein n=1 Tax=Cladophialophora psammophila CBS 110553 TaxID=1182543 RepID=W9VVH2_9EURO|nr:uncharacterized protein A1O5_12657 [Cladophialophora psammophila CBS 110553]EXJ56201.1 hypothetical protein A1O5_12657 [Cladophialophora psammophila CBS 110553]
MIATLGKNLEALSEGIQCHIQAGSKYISVCTPPDTFGEVKAVSTSSANKREQLVLAITNVPQDRKKEHKIIVFADDDIAFPKNTVRWMLAAFEESKVGEVGTYQRARRINSG